MQTDPERAREGQSGIKQPLWHRLADSYRNPLWAAAHIINGGRSDDGFDYSRGRLIMQGDDVLEQILADPDALAEHSTVRTAAPEGYELEGEEALNVAWNAHLTATGQEIPSTVPTPGHPDPA